MTRRLTFFSHQATKHSRAVSSANRQQTVFPLRRRYEAFTALVLLHPPIPSWLCGFVASCDGEWIRFEWEPGRSAPAVENRSLTTLKLTTIDFRNRAFETGDSAFHKFQDNHQLLLQKQYAVLRRIRRENPRHH